MAEQSPIQRLLRIEPGIALGQWAYERVVNNWALITALLGGGGMTYLASITQWIQELGPFAVAGAGALSLLTFWLFLSVIRYFRAKERQRLAMADATLKWKEQVDTVNPLDQQFQRQRIRLSDLPHPISSRIENKRFLDCQLQGPANVIVQGNTSFDHMGFNKCDLVVVNNKKSIPINNVIALKDCQVIGCEMLNCTLYIPPEMIPIFRDLGANFISLTGDQEIDSPTPSDTPAEKQP